MARIYFALALFAVGMLVTNLVIGLWIGDFNGASRQLLAAKRNWDRLQRDEASPQERSAAKQQLDRASQTFAPIQRRKMLHMLTGIAAALVTVLVNSITITYFIGTSRWCREVVETYGLKATLAEDSQRLKRRTFPWALGSILVILTVITLGAASDPAAHPRSAIWVMPHYLCAMMGTLFIAWSFLIQVGKIGANYEVIETILADVARIRSQRGWDQPVKEAAV